MLFSKPLSAMKEKGLGAGCYLDGGLGSLAGRCSALGALCGPRRSRFWSLSFVPLTAPCGSYHADQQGCVPPLVTQWALLYQVLCANDLAACRGTLKLSRVTHVTRGRV